MKRGPGIIAEQRVLSEALAGKLAAAPGTPIQPTLVMDPYGIAPLSALLCFDTAEEEAFIVTLQDGAGRAYLHYETPAARRHRIIVPALVNGEAVTLAAAGSGGSQVVQTLPVRSVEVSVAASFTGEGPDNGLLFALPADGETQPLALNRFGALCWTLTLPLNHCLRWLDNGHFLCGAGPQLAPPYSGTVIWEMDLLGHVYKEYRFEDGFVSDLAVLEDGTIVAITQAAWQGTARDTLVWIDSESGAIIRRLRAADYLPMGCGTAGQTGSDWFQGTSLRYDPASGLLCWSGIAQNVVLEVDAASAEVRRIIGAVDGWDDKRTALDRFTRPVLRGSFAQAYGVQRWGDALYYVNANRYPLDRKLAPTPFNILRLDLKSGRLATFLANEEALISPILCDLTLSETGEALVLAGGLSEAGALVPALFARYGQPDLPLSARAFLYREGRRLGDWRFDTSLAAVSLWRPQQLVFSDESRGVLGSWAPSFEVDIDLPFSSEEPLDENLGLRFWQDEARLYLSGNFFKGEACVLILRQGDERHQFFLTTNRMPLGTEWLCTHTDGVERPLRWAIPCAQLEGEWAIDLQIDDFLYHTDETAIF